MLRETAREQHAQPAFLFLHWTTWVQSRQSVHEGKQPINIYILESKDKEGLWELRATTSLIR